MKHEIWYLLRNRRLQLVSAPNAAGVMLWAWDDEFGGVPGSYYSAHGAVEAMEKAGGISEGTPFPEVAGNAAA